MNAYAESSALLAWLLGESSGAGMRQCLAQASAVATSRLTLLECERSLIRAVGEGRIDENAAGEARGLLATVAARWILVDVTGEILDRARRPFPAEPVRTLDALHLATMLYLSPHLPPLDLLSLDDRVRKNSALLGFRSLLSA